MNRQFLKPGHRAVDPVVLDRPFAMPPTSLEIILDLPPPPSANRIWRHARGHVYRSKEYMNWQAECDATIMGCKHCRGKHIAGKFEAHIYIAESVRGDGDNKIKATLDWLQSRGFVANDKHCRKVTAEWVPTAEAPLGCRVHLRSLHG